MKWLKISFSILGLLVLISIIALASLAYLIDPNQLKPILIEETKKNTGYQLAIDGKLSWSFYPRLAIKIDHLALSEPAKPPFVTLQDISITTKLSHLLHNNEKWKAKVFISHMSLMNLRAEKVTADLHWENQILTLKPIQASLYSGSLTGMAAGRDLGSLARWQWKITFSDIQLRPFLQDMNGPDSKINISGIGQVQLQAETQGKTREQILNNMIGTGEFSLKEGVVQGLDLNYFMQTADALLNKQQITAPDNIHQTAFSSLTGTLIIKNGMIETRNMLLISPAFTTQGKGTIGLLSEALNLSLLVKPQENAKTQWEIPILVTGEMNHPDIKLDVSNMQKLIAREELEKLKMKAEQIKEHISEKAQNLLQNLLGK